jgi:hypothetical protein
MEDETRKMSASLPNEMIAKYKNGCKIFFETGTFAGDSLASAYEEGFDLLYSVELDVKTFNEAFQRFLPHNNIVVMQGKSAVIMEQILPYVEIPTMFWLDAHPETGLGCTPILEELHAISRMKAPAVILADDMRLMGMGRWTVTIPDIIQAVREINPRYEIVFEPNTHNPKDIMVAYLPEGE